MKIFGNECSEGQVAISLESQLQRIAVESEVLVNLIETFKTTIPNFVNNLKDVNLHFLDSLKEQTKSDISLSKKEKKVIEIASHIDFLNFGERLVSVPEGFKGNLLSYAQLLNKTATEAYQVQNTVLNEYSAILSSFITNKEDKISLKDHTEFFSRIKSKRLELSNQLSHFTGPVTGVSKSKLKNVLSRISDIEPLLKEASKLSNQHSRARLTDIHASVSSCVDLLDIIIKNVSEGKIDNVSPNATKNISAGAFEVAKYVEFVGIIYFDIMVFLNSLDSIMDTILKVNEN